MGATAGRKPWAGSTRASRLPPDWRTAIRPAVLARDEYKCQLRYEMCTVEAEDVDHIEPGDDHRMENLQAVCNPCHNKKTADERPRPPSLYRTPERHPGLL